MRGEIDHAHSVPFCSRGIMTRRYLLLAVVLLLGAALVTPCEAQWRMRAVYKLKRARQLHSDARSKEDLTKALNTCEEALRIFEKHGGIRGKAVALYQMGVISRKLGNYQEALKCQQEAREIRRRLGDSRGESASLKGMGRIYSLQGRHGEAVRFFREALDLDKRLGADTVDGTTLLAVAAAYNRLGQHAKAMTFSEKAVDIAKKLGNRKLEGLALLNMGKIYQNMGEYSKALHSFQEGRDMSRELGNVRGEGISLRHIAGVYGATGEYGKALGSYEKALTISRRTGSVHLEGSIHNSMGQIYAQAGDNESALKHYQEALKILDGIGVSTKGSHHLIANLYMDTGDLEKAESFVKAAGSSAAMGRFHLLRENYPKAKAAYKQVLALGEKSGNVNALFTGCTGLGRVLEAQEDYDSAERYYEKGMKLTEEIRSGLLPSERVNFFRIRINGFSRLAPARGLTRVRLKQNRAAESIVSSEVTRARAFAESISLKPDQGYKGVPKDLLTRENELVTRLASLKKERHGIPRDTQSKRYADLSGEIEQAETDLADFVDKLWQDYKPYAAVKYPRPVTLKDSAVSQDEHIILFDVLDEGVGVKHLKGKEISRTFFIRWDRRDLERDVDRFRKPFEQVKLHEFDPQLGHRLFKRLLAPVMDGIPPDTPIVIVPDGVLAILPFEALVMSGTATWKKASWGDYPVGLTYLGDAYPVSYYQSITALTLSRTARTGGKMGTSLLVVADPVFDITDERANADVETDGASWERRYLLDTVEAMDRAGNGSFTFDRLPETSKMAEHLKDLYRGDSKILTGLDANKAHLLDTMGPNLHSYGWIVFATHGWAGNLMPGVNEPFLAMTMVLPRTDGFLKMTEVLGLDLNAELVALPACQTGLGIDLSGEGVMSMGRAFQYAGARSVLMSLWSVAERPTVALVESLFQHIKQGRAKLDSLRLARKEIRRQGFEHPFFWAAFILVGEVK